MAEEFIMPTKYNKAGCGLSVAVYNLDDDITYDRVIIYLEDEQQEVDILGTNTSSAIFSNLIEDKIYPVTAIVYTNEYTKELTTKLIAQKRIEPSVTTNHISGGVSRPHMRCKGTAF